MNFAAALAVVGGQPLFSSALLLAGTHVDPAEVRTQLARWVRTGRVQQLRRGLYVVAPPYRTIEPHPFVVANALRRGSYVSLQSALAFHGLIPERVPVVTSVSAGRPGRIDTPLGSHLFRHLKREMVIGYHEADVAAGQTALVATPEKALLDLVYLTRAGDSPDALCELRLQNLDGVDAAALEALAARLARPKLSRGVRALVRMLEEPEGEPL